MNIQLINYKIQMLKTWLPWTSLWSRIMNSFWKLIIILIWHALHLKREALLYPKRQELILKPTERASQFSFLLHLLWDGMVRLKHRDNKRPRRASDVLVTSLKHAENQVKEKMWSSFDRPSSWKYFSLIRKLLTCSGMLLNELAFGLSQSIEKSED